MPASEFAEWSKARLVRIERVLDENLKGQQGVPDELLAAMKYAVLDGGKRIRPLLAYAAGEAAGASMDASDAVAAAVELIHAYSLVHDDMPCMDDDSLRRGKPTCHVVFGQARALLVGDALQSLAFELLASADTVGHETRVKWVQLLAVAAGGAGMAGGQDVDLASTRQWLDIAQLERMHRLKTGALIGAAVRMAAAAGRVDAARKEGLERFATPAGLLFQVVDDLLDGERDSATLGKTAGKDAAQGKATFVTVLGKEQARLRAQALQAEAVEALAPLGALGERLRQLCDFIAQRKH